MFFPVRTDRALRKTPWVNYALIAANVVVFFMTHGSGSREINARWILNPQIPQLLGDWLAYPYLTYQFLHADGMHLLGNMLYLWIFGNNVEDAMGHAKFVVFYILSGILAALSHALTDPSSDIPMVPGASRPFTPRRRRRGPRGAATRNRPP